MLLLLRYICLLSCCWLPFYGTAQSITRVEYFFNTDPGFGNATTVSIPSGQTNLNNLAIAANIGSLPDGLNQFCVRSFDGIHWSVTARQVFFKGSTTTNITAIEYFFDTDPGFGNGIKAAFTASNNISNFLIPVNISGLTNGVHILFIRSYDGTKWSLTASQVFFKGSAISNISAIEYFFDTDPGFGNGTKATFTAANNISNLSIAVNTSGLSSGLHLLFVRSFDGSKWSITNSIAFFKDMAVADITRIEYFIDTDPGFGNATPVNFTAAANVADLAIPVSISGLTGGTHRLFLRSRDANGKWSVTAFKSFDINANQPPVANAGTDQTIILPTNSVTLNGSASTDPDGTIATYAWSKKSGPSNGIITNPSQASTTVTDLVQGVYEFELTVTDNNGASATDVVVITVQVATSVSNLFASGINCFYPNPSVSGEVRIETGNEVVKQVLIFHHNGQQMQTQFNAATRVLSTRNLAAGLYMIKVQTNKSTRYCRLLVL